MTRKKKQISMIALLVLTCFFLCGGIFSSKEMVMDAEEIHVYRNEPVEYFLLRLNTSPDVVKKEYKNQYFMMFGSVKSKSKDNKQIKLGMTSNKSTARLTCNGSEEEVVNVISNLRIGDTVKVYGKMTQSIWGEWSMSVDKIERSYEKTVSRTAYSALSGKTVDATKLETRELKDGKIKFFIPEEWKGVEKNLIDENLGSMEGYQYCLNEINRHSVQPESLFVCYFSNEKHLLRPSDKGSTEQIERAIVQNILGDDLGKADKKMTTVYGAEYHYYQDAYDSTFGKKYHAEFIFQPDGTDGFIVYLYVYLEKSHLDDVMLMLRLVEP